MRKTPVSNSRKFITKRTYNYKREVCAKKLFACLLAAHKNIRRQLIIIKNKHEKKALCKQKYFLSVCKLAQKGSR